MNDAFDSRRIFDRSAWLRDKGGWYHSFELPDGSLLEGVQPVEMQRARWDGYGLPADLAGRAVLDIGAWDGWFSFEAERRGARVTAVDCVEVPNFVRMKRLLGSRADYRIEDVYDLPAAGLGQFDFVLFLGVLYHLRHPLLALEIVCGLTRETAIVQSFVIDAGTWMDHPDRMPWMEFYETDELGNLLDNWNGPSLSCLLAMCRAAGFARVEFLRCEDSHAAVRCHRRWPDPPADALRAPTLTGVAHTRNGGINFQTGKDEYVSWWFRSDEPSLTREDVWAEVGGFGAPAIYLRREPDGGWYANTRVPPGLAEGWHEARVRTRRSAASDPLRVAVDIPAHSAGLALSDAADGVTWERRAVDQSRGGYLSLWIAGLAPNCDRNNIVARLGDERLRIDFIGEPDAHGFRQVNARIAEPLPPGGYALSITFGPARIDGPEISVR